MFCHPAIIRRREVSRSATGILLTLLMCSLFQDDSLGGDNAIFQQFTQHIGRQIHKDKQAFAHANSCVLWFYKLKTMPSSTAQGIAWNPTPSSQVEMDCRRSYPRGLDDARADLAKTQTVLSVSLTFYQFALVADRNDDAIYSPAELHDLFRSLSLSYYDEDPTPKQVTALTDRFDSLYRKRNMDALMQGMSDLHERGYRVTPSDRVELDRVMG